MIFTLRLESMMERLSQAAASGSKRDSLSRLVFPRTRIELARTERVLFRGLFRLCEVVLPASGSSAVIEPEDVEAARKGREVGSRFTRRGADTFTRCFATSNDCAFGRSVQRTLIIMHTLRSANGCGIQRSETHFKHRLSSAIPHRHVIP